MSLGGGIAGWISGRDTPTLVALACLALFFGGFAGYCALLRQRYAITLHPDAVEIAMVFRHKRVEKRDITGWSTSDDDSWASVVKLAVKDDRKSVDLPLGNLDEPELLDWLDPIPNTDELAKAESYDAIMADDQYGASPEARQKALLRERSIASRASIGAILLSIWIMLWPTPYLAAVGVGLLIPLAVFVLAIMLKDRWDFAGARGGDMRPSLVLAYLFPIGALALRSLDYRFADYPRLFVIAVVFAAIAWLLLHLLRPSTRQLSLGHTGLALILAVYGYSAAAHLNVQLDPSRAQTFAVEVQASEADGKDSSITLAPWGPYIEPYNARVSEDLQARAPAGTMVQIDLYHGLIGARWWTITAHAAAPAQAGSAAPLQ